MNACALSARPAAPNGAAPQGKRKSLQTCCLQASLRAESRTRTGDLFITNELLYQLSYFGDCGAKVGISRETAKQSGEKIAHGRDEPAAKSPKNASCKTLIINISEMVKT